MEYKGQNNKMNTSIMPFSIECIYTCGLSIQFARSTISDILSSLELILMNLYKDQLAFVSNKEVGFTLS